MKKILIVSNFLPYKKSKFIGAGYNTMLKILDDLKKEEYKIDFIALVNSESYCEVVEYENKAINKLIIYKITKLRKIMNIILNLFLPIFCAVRYDRRIKKYIKKNKNNYDLIFIEYTQNINYINLLKDFKGRKIISEVDIAYQGFERKYLVEKNKLKKLLLYFEYKRLEKFEKKQLRRYDTIIVQNEKDYNLIKNEILNIKILKPFFNKIRCKNIEKNTKNIAFLGAMNRLENEEAIIWFLENVWNSIVNENIFLYIIGANPREKLNMKVKNYKNVILTGFVEDLDDIISRIDIGIVPLKKGAGIKVKTLELLYAEKPVVSTKIGIEGIKVENGKGYLEAETSEEFIKYLNQLLKDEKKYTELKSYLKENKEKIVEGKNIVEILEESEIAINE